MEKAAEEAEGATDEAGAEAAELMAHSAGDIARIGELEAQVANLQSANAALLETMGETDTAEATSGGGGGREGEEEEDVPVAGGSAAGCRCRVARPSKSA